MGTAFKTCTGPVTPAGDESDEGDDKTNTEDDALVLLGKALLKVFP